MFCFCSKINPQLENIFLMVEKGISALTKNMFFFWTLNPHGKFSIWSNPQLAAWQATTSVPSASSHQGAGDRWKTSSFVREKGHIFHLILIHVYCMPGTCECPRFFLVSTLTPPKKLFSNQNKGHQRDQVHIMYMYVYIYIFIFIYKYMYGTRPHKSNFDVLLITLVRIPWCFCNRGWVPHIAMHIDTYMNVSG